MRPNDQNARMGELMRAGATRRTAMQAPATPDAHDELNRWIRDQAERGVVHGDQLAATAGTETTTDTEDTDR